MTQDTMKSTAWTIDKAHSQVEFAVKHMMFTTVRGQFRTYDAMVHVNEETPSGSSVEVTIETGSIDTGVADRDAHLRSADFFDVESHPKIVFTSRRVEGGSFEEGTRFKLIGDLTIRDTTREIELDVTFEGRGLDPWGQEKLAFAAQGSIDRYDYGLTWNQALETGGVLVGREIRLTVNAQFVRAA